MKGKTGFPGMNTLVRKAQEMQQKLQDMQEKALDIEVEDQSGGGMVKVRVNGKNEIVWMSIDPAVIDPKDSEMLAQLIIAAVNNAQAKVKDITRKELEDITGGINLPGLF